MHLKARQELVPAASLALRSIAMSKFKVGDKVYTKHVFFLLSDGVIAQVIATPSHRFGRYVLKASFDWIDGGRQTDFFRKWPWQMHKL